MTNAFKTILVSATVLLGLFAGVLFTASIAISPSLALLDATNYTIVKQDQIQILQVTMSIISTVYSVLALYIMFRAKTLGYSKLFQLTLYAFLLVLIALIYSAFTDIPYNQQILQWDASAPPADWSEIRQKWDIANQIRTIPTLLAFILQTYGLLTIAQKHD